MNNLKILVSLLIFMSPVFSEVAFATITDCVNADSTGNMLHVSFDSKLNTGTIDLTANGVTATSYLLHAYIMNDSSPGFYYYEGLAKIPYSTADARFFTLKLSSDDSSANLKVSDVGGSNAVLTVMSACTVLLDPIHW